jgi:hypothetical protein
MREHSERLPPWIGTVANAVVVGFKLGVVDPVGNVGLGSRAVVGSAKGVHLITVSVLAKMAVTHDSGPLDIRRVGRTSGATSVNDRAITIGIMRMTTGKVMSNLMHKRDQIPNHPVIQADKTSTNTGRQSIPVIRSAQNANVGNTSSESFPQKSVMQINSLGVPRSRGPNGSHFGQSS